MTARTWRRAGALATFALLFASYATAWRLSGAPDEMHMWFWEDFAVSYSFVLGNDEPNIDLDRERDEVRAAFLEWEDDPGSEIFFSEGPEVSAAALGFTRDGQNVVTFDDPYDDLAPGVLGLTQTWYSLTETRDVGGTSFMRIVEADIVFAEDDDFVTHEEAESACNNEVDLRAAAVHEIGHLMGLGHSSVPEATMFFVLADCDSTKAGLHSDDEAGASAIYPLPTCDAYPAATGDPLSSCANDIQPVTLSGLGSAIIGCRDLVEYRWRNTSGLDTGWSTDSELVDLPFESTSYSLDMRCFYPACEASSAPVDVEVHELPAADAGPSHGICSGAVRLGGDPPAAGGAGPYAYCWSAVPADASMTCTDCGNPNASPAVTTTYTLTVTDANLCTTSDDTVVELQVPEPPLPVGGSLRLHRELGDLHLSWQPPGGSVSGYVIRRFTDRAQTPPGDPIATVDVDTEIALAGEVAAPPAAGFYRVAGRNCLGEESAP